MPKDTRFNKPTLIFEYLVNLQYRYYIINKFACFISLKKTSLLSIFVTLFAFAIVAYIFCFLNLFFKQLL